MKIVDIPEQWRRRAIVIAESAVVPPSWFAAEELAKAGEYRLPQRRSEFLLSRAAAKLLATELGLVPDPVSCRIEQRRLGSRYVSLSHSAPYAAAAIDEAPVGIDVQVVRPINERAAHLFLTDAEEEMMRSSSIDDALIHFWCAKEAVWKRLGGATETLKRVPLALEGEFAVGMRFDAVETVRIGDVVVALTV